MSTEDLTYEWLPNLTNYEAKIIMGLTAQEAMACAMGFIGPATVIPSFLGIIVAVLTAILILLIIKKVDRFGQRSLFVYLVIRLWERINQKEIEIPLIMGGGSGRIELENWEGDTILTLDDLGV